MSSLPRTSLLILWLSVNAGAQTITTVAGTDWFFPALPLPALQAPLGIVSSVVVDAGGNYYIADESNYRVFKVDASGTLTAVAGNGISGYLGDNGPAIQASISRVASMAIDHAGNLYLADMDNNKIRKVGVNGIITTVVGVFGQGYFGDGGPAASAGLALPMGVAVNSAGELFIGDTGNFRVRKVDSSGIITTIAGNGMQYYCPLSSGHATDICLIYPEGVAGDDSGNVYIADAVAIRMVDASGNLSNPFPYGGCSTSGGTNEGICGPSGVRLDATGNLLIADQGGHAIRKVINGVISTVAGNGVQGYSGDGGPATNASLNAPADMAVDALGNLFVADENNHGIRKVAGGSISTVAGNGAYMYAGDGGPAINAVFQMPWNVGADGSGNIFIADIAADRVRKINPDGLISTAAGNGRQGPPVDGVQATSAFLYYPQGLAADSAGNLYIADSNNNVVRMVSTAGVITTVAGNGFFGPHYDNVPATSTAVPSPMGVAVDHFGNLFIANTNDSVVYEVSLGMITTVAGKWAQGGFSGDGGPAESAQLNWPSYLAVSPSGDLYIEDSANNRIRRVSGGTITTFAGNGACGHDGDNGPATGASLCFPVGLTVDPAGNVFIVDPPLIREVDSRGIITTVAGYGTGGYSGDGGPALSALISTQGIAMDTACNLFLADSFHQRIREVSGLSLTVSPGSVFLDATSQQGPTETITAAAPSCTWTTSAQAPWISIPSGAKESGSGTVIFSVPANTTGASRTSTLTIGGHVIPVTQRETADVFTDVAPSDYFFDFANVMFQAGITGGCSSQPLDYCPDATTNRGEMAVFLIAAIEGGHTFTYTANPYFTDVPPSHPFFKFIQKLKDLGITAGCTLTTYCPDDAVTRGEMAAFIIASRYGKTPYTYPSTPYFSDVPSTYLFFPFIQKMAQTGITAGCGGGLYCPDQTLTRGQMAVFTVTGLLNRLLPAGAPIIASVAPNVASRGQTVTVRLNGANTHFVQSQTQVVTPPGVSASNIQVSSATSLQVQLTINSNFTPGPVSVVALTGSEEAALPNGLLIQ